MGVPQTHFFKDNTRLDVRWILLAAYYNDKHRFELAAEIDSESGVLKRIFAIRAVTGWTAFDPEMAGTAVELTHDDIRSLSAVVHRTTMEGFEGICRRDLSPGGGAGGTGAMTSQLSAWFTQDERSFGGGGRVKASHNVQIAYDPEALIAFNVRIFGSPNGILEATEFVPHECIESDGTNDRERS